MGVWTGLQPPVPWVVEYLRVGILLLLSSQRLQPRHRHLLLAQRFVLVAQRLVSSGLQRLDELRPVSQLRRQRLCVPLRRLRVEG